MTQDYDSGKATVPSTMRVIFGIAMIIIYIGMGVLLFINFFQWGPGILQWLRWIGGCVFVIYGLWRAFRQFRGIDSPV